MNIIIPIGGIGKRFKDNCYTLPKALISINDKPMIFYLLENLSITSNDIVYIPYNKEYKDYKFESLLTRHFNINFKFLCLDYDTRGAAETINLTIKHFNIKEDIPVICLDCDNYYKCDILKLWNKDNCVFVFEDNETKPIYSYIEVKDDNIIDIKEKEKISNYACTGAYGFSSIKILKEYTDIILLNNITMNKEFYTSCVIKEMLKSNIFKYKIIDKNDYKCLGTPEQVNLLLNS